MNPIRLFTVARRGVKVALRTPIQFLGAPLITSFLYIFVFGSIMGERVGSIAGVSYITFVFPGILTLNVIMTAFNGTAMNIYFARFLHFIQETLVSPISYSELILGHMLAVFVRVLIVGAGIALIGTLFGAVSLAHPFFLIFWLLITSAFFGLLGFLTGLWADNFEQLGMFPTFIITPLAFIGGMFTSLSMLPGWMQIVAQFNPFFYVVDGFRWAMTGYTETSILFASAVMGVGTIAFFMLVVFLVSRGWRIRE